MSAQHCSVKNGGVGKGGAHANYVSGQDKYAGREDLLSVVDGNLPAWAKNGVEFFSAADRNERANGRTYKEVEFSIPREVADPVKYAEQFAEKLLGKDYPFLMGVHSKTAADGKPNTHGHLMFSERKLDGIERTEEKFFARANSKNPEKGGTAKDRSMNSKEFVKSVRALHKSHAAENGVHLDMRNWKERGADRPEPKVGPAHPRAELNPVRELKLDYVSTIREARALAEKQTQVTRLVSVLDTRKEQVQVIEIAQSITAALTQRKENERAALGRIGNNLTAAGRAIEATGINISRTDGVIESAKGLVLASREHLRAGLIHAGSPDRNPQRVTEAVGRRVAGSNYEKAVGAAQRHIEGTCDLVQQIGRLVQPVTNPIATALNTVVRDERYRVAQAVALATAQAAQAKATAEREAEKPKNDPEWLTPSIKSEPRLGSRYYSPENIAKREAAQAEKLAQIEQKVIADGLNQAQRAIVMANVRANIEKANAAQVQQAAAPEKPSPLTPADRDLVQRIEAAIKADDQKELEACHKAISSTKREATQAAAALKPFNDSPKALRDAIDSVLWQVQAQQNREESTRRQSMDRALERANAHRDTRRPLVFGKPEWDATDEENVRNFEAKREAVRRIEKEFTQRIEQEKQRVTKEHQQGAASNAKNAPEREKAVGRCEGLDEVSKRLEGALKPHRDREREEERNNDHGISR